MTKRFLMLSFAAMAIMPWAANASLIYGTLNITGSVDVSAANIMFIGNSFTAGPVQQGTFSTLANTAGTIANFANPPDVTDPPNTTDLDQADFMTFAAAPNITITLDFLKAGTDGPAGCTDTPAAAGQECTPGTPGTTTESPYNLFNTSATSSIDGFNIVGTEVDSSTGQTVAITGAFSQPFDDMNFQQILAAVEGGGTITVPFSAQFVAVAPTTTPEPSALFEFMMGIGLVGLSVVYRKRLKKA